MSTSSADEDAHSGSDASPPTHNQQVIPQAIRDFCSEVDKCSIAIQAIYPTFKRLETALGKPPTSLDPCQLRRLLPDYVVANLVSVASAELDSLSSQVRSKVQKAAKSWKLSRRHLLFLLANDHYQRGKPFFTELSLFAATCADPAHAFELLCRCAQTRRANRTIAPVKRPGVSQEAAGIILDDIRCATTIFAQTTGAAPMLGPPSPAKQITQTSVQEERREVAKSPTPSSPESAIRFSPTPEASRAAPSDHHLPSIVSAKQSEIPIPHSLDASPSIFADTPRQQPQQGDCLESLDFDSIFGDDDNDDCDSDYAYDFSPGGNINIHPGAVIHQDDVDNIESLSGPVVHASEAGSSSPVHDMSAPLQLPESVNTKLRDPEQSAPEAKRHHPENHTDEISDASTKATETRHHTTSARGDILPQTTLEPILEEGESSLEGASALGKDSLVLNSACTILDPSTWIRGEWLVSALSDNHWALVIIRREGRTLRVPEYYDSLPAKTNFMASKRHVSSFLRHYLPQSQHAGQTLYQCVAPIQDGGNDCGVFTFAFALHTVAAKPLPRRLPSATWRLILAACLGVQDISWWSLIPEETRITTIRLESEVADNLDDGFDSYMAMMTSVQAWQQRATNHMRKQLEDSQEAVIEVTTDFEVVLDMLRVIMAAADRRIGELEVQLSVPAQYTAGGCRRRERELEAAKTVRGHAVTASSRIGEVVKCLGGRVEELSRKIDAIQPNRTNCAAA
ncbi:uncharacterized protein CTRU02_215695 [Colletotrichum truncatum]|uniref:Uncharacterized protein n=1 Tax=Colletotrichum truncatum TaxID=5467 RepID=A0ACC3YBX7_COLTU